MSSRNIDATFANFRNGCDDAPAGLFASEKQLRQAIGDAVDGLMREARLVGLTPCNSDGAHHVEATIYAWLTKGTTFGASLEGLGKYGDPRGYYARAANAAAARHAAQHGHF